MRLRLPRWLRREPAPQGRHVRTAAPVAVTGAGGALVTAAVEPFLVAEASAHADPPTDGPWSGPPTPAAPDGVAGEAAAVDPDGPVPVTAGDLGTTAEPLPPVPDATLDPVPEAVADTQPAAVPEPTVGLGFADGGLLELAPDDPRLAGFQDAAAAVLGHDRA